MVHLIGCGGPAFGGRGSGAWQWIWPPQNLELLSVRRALHSEEVAWRLLGGGSAFGGGGGESSDIGLLLNVLLTRSSGKRFLPYDEQTFWLWCSWPRNWRAIWQHPSQASPSCQGEWSSSNPTMGSTDINLI